MSAPRVLLQPPQAGVKAALGVVRGALGGEKNIFEIKGGFLAIQKKRG